MAFYKKIISFITFFLTAISLSACKREEPFLTRGSSMGDNNLSKTRLEEIVNAIENEDVETLTEMFSENVLEQIIDLEGQIHELIDFYHGRMEKYEGTGPDVKASVHRGIKKKRLYGQYEVFTDEKVYCIHFLDQVVDDETSEEVGLSVIEIAEKEYSEQEGFWWHGSTEGPGIFVRDYKDIQDGEKIY